MQRAREANEGRRRRRDERGVAMVTVLVALVALIAAGALAIDVGLVWASRTQLQNAADAAALAGGANLIDKSGPSVTLADAEAAVLGQAGLNPSVAAPGGVAVDTADITYGHWDLDTRTFDPGVDLSDPDAVNAVNVVTRSDGAVNSPVPAFMARVLGRQDFSVGAEATAYLGFAGRVGPGRLDLPIAIDCCKLRGPDCEADYCETITTNPPNPCPLTSTAPAHQGAATVTCLEFHNTEEQNACWHVYDGDSPSINTPDILDIVETGYQQEVESLFPIYVDNGTKTPVIDEIQARMQGEGGYVGNAAGSDRYPPLDGYNDSWVVGFPVIECQSETHCAGGTVADMVGFVCFEIREVEVTPEKLIKGRFLCPDDPLFAECPIGPTGSGGEDFGIRADFPVLVR
jgi:Flp pilus assembly protein TadG